MEWMIGGSLLVVLAGGVVIALWWWRLAAQMAPYRDELEKAEARRRADAADEQRVVVIGKAGTDPARGPAAGRDQ